MPEKKEKKPEKQTAYIGLTILFLLFFAVVMVLVKFRLVQAETLPGIGPQLAERIVQYREEQGAFSEIEDIMAVKGIGEKKFKKLREYIVIS